MTLVNAEGKMGGRGSMQSKTIMYDMKSVLECNVTHVLMIAVTSGLDPLHVLMAIVIQSYNNRCNRSCLRIHKWKTTTAHSYKLTTASTTSTSVRYKALFIETTMSYFKDFLRRNGS